MKTAKTKVVKAWAVICPGSNEPYADLGAYGRHYVLLCDPDAKKQAERMSKVYPEGHQIVIPCTISFTIPKKTK